MKVDLAKKELARSDSDWEAEAGGRADELEMSFSSDQQSSSFNENDSYMDDSEQSGSGMQYNSDSGSVDSEQ